MKCPICNEETIGTKTKMWGCDFAHATCIKAYSLGKDDAAALAAQPGAVGEPMVVLHDDGYWTPCKTEAGRALNDRLNPAGSREVIHAAAPTEAKPAQDAVDAERYRELRRGMYWSVVDVIGDHLRDEALDGDIDRAISAKKSGS